MYDFHIHSCFSDDCTTELEAIAESALNRGLKGICYTDHVDIDYPSKDVKFMLDYDIYTDKIMKLRSKYKNQLNIYIGVEFGMQAHILNECNSFMNNKDFDFVIGSIHVVKQKELYMGKFLEGITEQKAIINYLEDLLTCVSSFNNYDVVGHFDVIRRYLPNDGQSFVYEDYREYIEEALKCIIASGKGIELNTASDGMPYFHPLPDILKLYKSLGGEIITLGSDSHKPDNLGRYFDRAIELLKNLGFRYYTYYSKRKPEFISIK